MKFATLTLIIGLLTSITLFGQNEITSAPTTEEEYNYLTKGYKVQIESGLDNKKGYKLERFGQFTEGAYSFDFRILFRENESEVAGILVIANSTAWGNNVYYLCIPFNNNDLMTKYQTSISLWDSSITKAYAKILSTYFINLTISAFEMEKKLKEKK